MGGGAEQEHVLFSKGSQVEVSSDDDGFRGAWYVATIVDLPTNSNSKKRKRRKTTSHNKYLVEYETLLADDVASKPLREYIDVSFMRPLPPTTDDDDQHPSSFQLNDLVDAFYRDGWWTGIITRVRVREDDDKFVVLFQNPPDEIEFARSNLRVHRDWVDRKWVMPEKQRMMGSMFSVGTAVEVSLDRENLRDVWFLASFLREIGNDAFLVEYQSSGMGDGEGLSEVTVDALHIRPSPPHLEYKNFVLFEKVDAFCGFGWWRGVITSFLKDRRYTVILNHTNEEKELNHWEIRPHMDWIDGKWVIASQGIIERKGGANHQRRKRGRPPKLLVERPIGEEKNGAETASYQMVVKDCATNEAVQSTESGICFRGMMGFRDDYPLKFSIKKNLKLIVDDKKLLRGPLRHNNKLSNIMSMPLAKIDYQSNEIIAQKSGRQLKKHSSKRKMKRSMTNSETPSQDCTSKDVEVVINEIPSHIFDDRPLLMWFEGMNSPSTVNDSRISLGTTVEQYVEASGIQDENAMQSPAIASTDTNASEKNRNWPFAKHSPIWETLECMDIFQMMPQQPHFQPLVKSKEDRREGLAIANMVTFAGVAETTSKLQLSDPRSIIDSSLETLSDLETHGFDVDPIRGRLHELLSMKDGQGKLLEESKGVQMKINERSLEKNKIDEEIHESKRKMEDLEEKLALATSMMEMKDYEIAALQSKMEVIDQDILNAELDFKRLAAVPLCK